jgi:DNA-directed RNA polymerase specialized sigma24 family protein
LTEAEMCLRVDVYRAIGRLNPRQRTIVLLVVVFDLTVREAAQVVGVSRSYCHCLLRRALARLRVLLRSHGIIHRSPVPRKKREDK